MPDDDTIPFLRLARKFFDNPLWCEKREYSKAECWLDLIATVAIRESTVIIGNGAIKVKRGQSIRSLSTWANRWGMTKSKANRVLNLFQSLNMIESEHVGKLKRLTVCKYDTYNRSRNGSETEVKQKRNGSETEVKTDKEGKEYKELKEVKNMAQAPTQTIADRIQSFKEKVHKAWKEKGGETFLSIEEMKDFFNYWSEHGDGDKKFRREKEVTFGIGRRLGTWKRNNQKFGRDEKRKDFIDPDFLDENGDFIPVDHNKLNFGEAR